MNFDHYVRDIPPHRKKYFLELLNLINDMYPDAVTSMKYKMPTFSRDEGWVALASQKRYISLYTCSAEHLDAFKKKYPNVKTGKGCINIQDRDDFPVIELATVIKSAMEKRYD